MNYGLKADLCSGSLYQNCLFSAYLNMPFNTWSVDNGVTVQYSIVGGPNCENLYCSNDIKSKSPQNCSFYLPKNNGESLYLVSQAGNSADIPATFSLKIDCSKTGNSTIQKYTQGCPANPANSRKNIKIETPHSVVTSQYDPIVYSFVVCPTSGKISSFSFVLTAADQNSAFSSYFCPNTTCLSGLSPDGWFDPSASGLNTVSQPHLLGGQLSVAIYGWGNVNSSNYFVFNIQTQTTSS